MCFLQLMTQFRDARMTPWDVPDVYFTVAALSLCLALCSNALSDLVPCTDGVITLNATNSNATLNCSDEALDVTIFIDGRVNYPSPDHYIIWMVSTARSISLVFIAESNGEVQLYVTCNVSMSSGTRTPFFTMNRSDLSQGPPSPGGPNETVTITFSKNIVVSENKVPFLNFSDVARVAVRIEGTSSDRVSVSLNLAAPFLFVGNLLTASCRSAVEVFLVEAEWEVLFNQRSSCFEVRQSALTTFALLDNTVATVPGSPSFNTLWHFAPEATNVSMILELNRNSTMKIDDWGFAVIKVEGTSTMEASILILAGSRVESSASDVLVVDVASAPQLIGFTVAISLMFLPSSSLCNDREETYPPIDTQNIDQQRHT